MADKVKIVIVAALSRQNHAIGKKSELLWHIPDDLKRFKELTGNHPVVMGRKTFESIVKILGKPLPGRPNIVVTRNSDYMHEGAIVVSSVAEGLQRARELDQEEIHIGGGSEIYKQVIPLVDELRLTLVNDEPKADTFFPAFENDFEISKVYEMRKHNDISYQFVDYTRKNSESIQ